MRFVTAQECHLRDGTFVMSHTVYDSTWQLLQRALHTPTVTHVCNLHSAAHPVLHNCIFVRLQAAPTLKQNTDDCSIILRKGVQAIRCMASHCHHEMDATSCHDLLHLYAFAEIICLSLQGIKSLSEQHQPVAVTEG